MTHHTVDDLTRAHGVDRLVPVWRDPDEAARWNWYVAELAYVRLWRTFGTALGVIAAVCAAIAVTSIAAGDDFLYPVLAAVLAAVGAGLLTSTSEQHDAALRIGQAVHAPFLTTPAAAWAYEAIRVTDAPLGRARTEQFRAVLNGLSAEQQVKTPEHAALLTLGHAAAAVA